VRSGLPNENQSAASRNETVSARKAPKKRIAVTRNTQPAAADVIGAPPAAGNRPVYDYYDDDTGDRDRQDADHAPGRVVPSRSDSHDSRAHRNTSKTKSRVIVRRQDDWDQQSGRADDGRRAVLPPQPAPAQSFLGGLFGAQRSF